MSTIDDRQNLEEATVVDIFCGIGGLAHGFVREGFTVAAGVDADPSCKYAFEQNNNAIFINEEIENIKPKKISKLYPDGHAKILVGCAPCQPFSSYSGNNADDKKWRLLYKFADLIKSVRPDIVSMENVTRLRIFAGGKVFRDFINKLENIGYYVTSYDVFCPDYGVPQNRTRLVLFASKYANIKLIDKTHSPRRCITVRDAISRLEPIKHGEASCRDPIHLASRLSKINLKRIRQSVPGGTWRDWSKKLIAECHKKETGHTYPSVYGRMIWDEPSPTITTQCYGFGNGRFGHPEQDRAISLREAALLQTFPRYYKLVASGEPIYMKVIGRHIGNAVPVRLGRVIARSIARHLEETNSG